MTSVNFLRSFLTGLCLQLVAVPLIGHAQQAVQTSPNFSTSLNPGLAIPAGTPLPDSAKLPAAPIAPPLATLPVPVAGAAAPLLPLTAVSQMPIADPGKLPWVGGIDPVRRAQATPTVSLKPVALAGVAPVATPEAASAAATEPTTSAQPDGAFPTVAMPLGADGAVPAITLSLRFGAAQAGKKLWVHPIDGGQTDGQEGARAVDVGPGG